MQLPAAWAQLVSVAYCFLFFFFLCPHHSHGKLSICKTVLKQNTMLTYTKSCTLRLKPVESY